jgi:hypothetical protein
MFKRIIVYESVKDDIAVRQHYKYTSLQNNDINNLHVFRISCYMVKTRNFMRKYIKNIKTESIINRIRNAIL